MFLNAPYSTPTHTHIPKPDGVPVPSVRAQVHGDAVPHPASPDSQEQQQQQHDGEGGGNSSSSDDDDGGDAFLDEYDEFADADAMSVATNAPSVDQQAPVDGASIVEAMPGGSSTTIHNRSHPPHPQCAYDQNQVVLTTAPTGWTSTRRSNSTTRTSRPSWSLAAPTSPRPPAPPAATMAGRACSVMVRVALASVLLA